MPEHPQMDDHQQLKLNYLDRVHSSLFEVGRRGHSILIIYFMVSIIMIFLSLGVIRIDQHIAFLGIIISIPLPFLLGAGGIAVAILQYYSVALGSYEERLRQEIVSTYQTLDFTPPSMSLDKRTNAFQFPSLTNVISSEFESTTFQPFILSPATSALPDILAKRKSPRGLVVRIVSVLVGLLILFVTLLLLPISAEYLAVAEIVHLQGWSGLSVLVILAVTILDAASLISLASRAPKVFASSIRDTIETFAPVIRTYESNVDAKELNENSLNLSTQVDDPD